MNNATRIEVISYIHQMLGELQKMALSENLPALAYFISKARVEADDALYGGEKFSDGEEGDSPT